MEIVEYHRVRGTMFWWGGFVLLIVLATLIFGHTTSITFDAPSSRSYQVLHGMLVPLAVLAPLGMYLVCGFATPCALALNRESAFRDIAWTKPVARPVIALRHILVDLAGILVAFAIFWVAAEICLARLGFGLGGGDGGAATVVLALGVCFMWYGLLLALTAGFSARAGLLTGLAWPVALVLASLGNKLGGAYGAIVRTINVVNPFAYLTGSQSTVSGDGPVSGVAVSAWNAPLDVRILIVYALAVVLCAIGTTVWSRREA
jgi:hypothetical protein